MEHNRVGQHIYDRNMNYQGGLHASVLAACEYCEEIWVIIQSINIDSSKSGGGSMKLAANDLYLKAA